MRKMHFVCLLLAALAITNYTVAQQPKKDSGFSKVYVDSLKKEYTEAVKVYTDSIKKISKEIPEKKVDTKWSELRPIANFVIVIGFFVVMILLYCRFFSHIKMFRQRIGFQSIKLIGLILIFPGICILALVGGSEVLSGPTLAALLGTIAGYVLSRDDEPKDTPKENNNANEDKEKLKKLEDEIKNIKAKNPNLIV